MTIRCFFYVRALFSRAWGPSEKAKREANSPTLLIAERSRVFRIFSSFKTIYCVPHYFQLAALPATRAQRNIGLLDTSPPPTDAPIWWTVNSFQKNDTLVTGPALN